MLQRGGGLYFFQQGRLGQQLFTGRLNVLEGGIGHRASGDTHDIPARENVIPTKPHCFTHEPTHPIAFDGIADAFAGAKTEAAVGKSVRQDNQDDQAVLDTAPLASYLLKAAFIPKAILPAHGIVKNQTVKRLRPRRRRRLRTLRPPVVFIRARKP